MEDQNLTCVDCSAPFVFTAGEQEFYNSRNLSAPQRCKECREKRKAARGGGAGDRPMFDAVCSTCGKDCQVPFQPNGNKPVYCRDCFSSQRQQQ